MTIMMLNAMSDDLPHVRNHIADALATSTTTSIYGPSNIRSRLDVEQQLIDTAKGQSGDVALLANGKGGNSQGGRSKTCTECGRQGHSYCCTNCNSWGHYAKDCFGKGGSMEGKWEEVLAHKCAAREGANKGSKPAAKPASTGKPGAVHYDTGGRAYILDSETHEAIYIANPPAAPSSSSSDTESREFAGLACDTITPAFIRELSELDNDELALYSALDTLQASVDWRECSQPFDFAGITYKAPNQRQRTIVDPSIVPFFLDSGASVHISNTESDFYSLRPIPPRTVSGVGGSSIQALGVGTLRLVVSKGTHITLDHVLFIPTATVRLISVSSLCSVHRCIASFDASSCWVTARSGSRMLSGSLTSRRLYALSGGQLSADHVFLAQRIPDLQSWHRRLGHANYRAVYDLARSGNATGMPITLSTSPPICDACILGKQTKSIVPKVRTGVRLLGNWVSFMWISWSILTLYPPLVIST